jgi:hypothetical protein
MYTWAELMPILGILSSGEERTMIRRAAMDTWEREQPPGPKILPAGRKYPLEDPHWNNNGAAN